MWGNIVSESKKVGDKSDNRKYDPTPMETESTPQTALQGETVPPTKESFLATGGANASSQPNDDSDIEMKQEDIHILNVSGKVQFQEL